MVFRYGLETLDWSDKELKALDLKTSKRLKMHKMFCKKGSDGRLCLKRTNGENISLRI